MQQPQRLAVSQADRERLLTCTSDRQRPLCDWFASRGSAVGTTDTLRTMHSWALALEPLFQVTSLLSNALRSRERRLESCYASAAARQPR